MLVPVSPFCPYSPGIPGIPGEPGAPGIPLGPGDPVSPWSPFCPFNLKQELVGDPLLPACLGPRSPLVPSGGEFCVHKLKYYPNMIDGI